MKMDEDVSLKLQGIDEIIFDVCLTNVVVLVQPLTTPHSKLSNLVLR